MLNQENNSCLASKTPEESQGEEPKGEETKDEEPKGEEPIMLSERRSEELSWELQEERPPRFRRMVPAKEEPEVCPVCMDPLPLVIPFPPRRSIHCVDCVTKTLESYVRDSDCYLCKQNISELIEAIETKIDLEPNLSDMDHVFGHNRLGDFVYHSASVILADDLCENRVVLSTEFKPVQPNRYEVYKGKFIRIDTDFVTEPYDPKDHRRIKRWIRREVRDFFNIAYGWGTDYRTDMLMETLLEGACESELPLSRFLSPEFRRVCVKIFGSKGSNFCDELYYFARSGLSMEKYDLHTYYRQRCPYDFDSEYFSIT